MMLLLMMMLMMLIVVVVARFAMSVVGCVVTVSFVLLVDVVLLVVNGRRMLLRLVGLLLRQILCHLLRAVACEQWRRDEPCDAVCARLGDHIVQNVRIANRHNVIVKLGLKDVGERQCAPGSIVAAAVELIDRPLAVVGAIGWWLALQNHLAVGEQQIVADAAERIERDRKPHRDLVR